MAVTPKRATTRVRLQTPLRDEVLVDRGAAPPKPPPGYVWALCGYVGPIAQATKARYRLVKKS